MRVPLQANSALYENGFFPNPGFYGIEAPRAYLPRGKAGTRGFLSFASAESGNRAEAEFISLSISTLTGGEFREGGLKEFGEQDKNA
jgi:hypothetical protein